LSWPSSNRCVKNNEPTTASVVNARIHPRILNLAERRNRDRSIIVAPAVVFIVLIVAQVVDIVLIVARVIVIIAS
jgi:hypothetical protein